jgi:Asp-tRNA(Asn)/Glu-tRNA(Gln) amidotransferase B subunit
MMDHPSHQDVIDVAKQIGTLSGSPVVIEDICSRAISTMPSEAKAVRSGNFGPVNRLVAHVMRETKGKANAMQVREELLKQLSD